jgi:ankyrin repeat protein
MNRESVIYRTHEIKSEIIKSCQDILDVLKFYIQDNYLQKFKEVFEKSNINIDQKDGNQDTLLIIAVKSNRYEFVEYLLTNQADVNIQDSEFNSALHHALRNKFFRISNLLISKRADEYLKNIRGHTAWQTLYLDSDDDSSQ